MNSHNKNLFIIIFMCIWRKQDTLKVSIVILDSKAVLDAGIRRVLIYSKTILLFYIL